MSKGFSLTQYEKDTFYTGLAELQKKLIDTSRRNKLINYRVPPKSRFLRIIDESPDFIFQHLIEKEDKFKFLSIPEPEIDYVEIERLQTEKRRLINTAQQLVDQDTTYILAQIQECELKIKAQLDKKLLTPEERAQEINLDISKELPRLDIANASLNQRYTDKSLQTLHYPGEMEKILSVIERQARSFIEETGANVLYLSLGFLYWNESQHSEEINRSPLICIPITIKKIKSANQFLFTIEYSQEGLDCNRSLAEKLSNDYGILLPELNEETTYDAYIENIKSAIANHPSWKVKHEATLDFLHFGKILMYQNLKEELWDEDSLLQNPILQEIFLGRDGTNSIKIAPDYEIDAHKKANSILLVTDADSSQHSAIVDVLEGKNVIIEGPPGTGKSQTITNIIAALIAEGKSVLFVSEKLAALEVVHKRLSHLGLSDFCLELHSHKSQKTTVLKSIEQRLDAVHHDVQTFTSIMDEIDKKKNELKEYVELIHQDFGNFGCSIYDVLWKVERYQHSASYLSFKVQEIDKNSHSKYKEMVTLIDHYASLHKNYDLKNCYWKGLDTHKLNFSDKDDFILLLKELKGNFEQLQHQFSKLPCDVQNEFEQLDLLRGLTPLLLTHNAGISGGWLKEISKSPDAFRKIVSAMDTVEQESLSFYDEYKRLYEIRQLNREFEKKIMAISSVMSSLNQEINLPFKGEILYVESILNATRMLNQIPLNQYIGLNQLFGTTQFELILNEAIQQNQGINTYAIDALIPFNLSALLACELEELQAVEKAFNEKKDSLFNFFSKEYKKAKRYLAAILNDPLPSNKMLCQEYFTRATHYKKSIDEFERKDSYKIQFGINFQGTSTDWETIQTMHLWSKELRKAIKNIDLQTFFLSGNELMHESLTSKYDEIEQALQNVQQYVNGIFDGYGPRLAKQLELNTYGILDLFALKSKIEEFDTKIEFLQESFLKVFHKDEELSKNDFLNLFADSEIGILEALLKQYEHINDAALLHSQKMLETILFAKRRMQENYDALNMRSGNIFQIKDQIKNAVDLFDAIENSAIQNCLKETLFKEFAQNIVVLKEIKDIDEKLSSTMQTVEQYATLSLDIFCGETFNVNAGIEKLSALDSNIDMLMIWSDYQRFTQELKRVGLEDIVVAHERGILPTEMLGASLNYNFFNTLAKELYREYSIMNRFSRLSHEQVIEKFKSLDKEWIEKARQKIAHLAMQKEVPQGIRGGSKKDLTQMGLIQNEISKKKRHIPLRQLIKRSTGALKSLKPCFMMSPLSVAQYLPPQDITFDVLVIDEASQLRPEEAIGAIARVDQIVIVGDPKQLPPTSFFDSLDKSEEDNESMISESESILDFCLNLYQPIRQLKWHYRSQHESLIDFSNKQFYDGNLIVFPSPTIAKSDQLGIKHHYLKDAFYLDRKNKHEAKYVVEALEQQMKRFPNCSLGVGTFNTDQRDLIQALMDEKEKNSPVVSNFITKWSETNEPFFVKNLESLQGDERDVIFISTTFGKDRETQRVYQRFGPINSDVGWRRLNVLFTRAKQKMEIFTSMQSSDIIISPNSSRGVMALKAFLNYAESGKLSSNVILNQRGFDSEFEIAVSQLLSDCGYTVVPQVGVAGYFIDLAVVSKNNPNEYVLGIECDGATYHSSKSARDRDRLKQEVLEKLGWNIHRIWSVDWFKNRENEIKKLLDIIQKAQQKSTPFIKEKQTVDQALEIKDDVVTQVIINQPDLQADVAQQPRQFSSDQTIKEELIAFRDTVIAKQFKIDARCLLSPLMIDLFIKHKPLDMDEFRSEIPLKIRQNLDVEQLSFISNIFEILEKADE